MLRYKQSSDPANFLVNGFTWKQSGANLRAWNVRLMVSFALPLLPFNPFEFAFSSSFDSHGTGTGRDQRKSPVDFTIWEKRKTISVQRGQRERKETQWPIRHPTGHSEHGRGGDEEKERDKRLCDGRRRKRGPEEVGMRMRVRLVSIAVKPNVCL